MDTLTPSLGYRDPRAASRFLVDALGFTHVRWYDDRVTGEVHHAELRAPHGAVVHLTTEDPDTAYADADGQWRPVPPAEA